MRVPFAVFALAVLAAAAAAQTPPPLDKAELIRLLSNPLFAQTEVAEVVRRSCLTFRPTERDWADLRNVGAGGEVIASAASCESRRASSPPLARAVDQPLDPITVLAQPTDLVTSVGTATTVRVRVTRAGAPVRRVTLGLRGTTVLGLPRDAVAVTDDSGLAVFRLPAVARIGVHRFEIRGAGGTSFSGRPAVLFDVRAGRPKQMRVTPDYVVFGTETDSVASIVAALTDSLGNRVPGEAVDLSGGFGVPQTTLTDSSGRARFVVTAGSVPRGAALQLRVRDLAPAQVEIAAPAGLSGVRTGFSPLGSTRVRVRTALPEPLIFNARTVQGGVPLGRTVRFRALNAQVIPDSAVLDSTGQVRLDVTLGSRAGDAAVFASIDSIERILTLHAEAGPIDALILERDGSTLNGTTVTIPVATPFTMRLKAQDMYGNETSIDALGQALRANRERLNARKPNLQIVSLESSDAAVAVTLKALRPGVYNFVIGSGITASVRITATP